MFGRVDRADPKYLGKAWAEILSSRIQHKLQNLDKIRPKLLFQEDIRNLFSSSTTRGPGVSMSLEWLRGSTWVVKSGIGQQGKLPCA